jgi:hypothetical protein
MNRLTRYVLIAAVCCISQLAAADRQVILVTPKGVFSSVVVDGLPGPFEPLNADVIVQGFTPGGGGGETPPKPDPDEGDPHVEAVVDASKRLRDKDEGTAAAALVDALRRNGLTGRDFTEALVMAAKIADTTLGAGGRLKAWAASVTEITDKPGVILAGVTKAWGVSLGTMQDISEAVRDEGADSQAALDFAGIIALIRMVLELLRELGIL